MEASVSRVECEGKRSTAGVFISRCTKQPVATLVQTRVNGRVVGEVIEVCHVRDFDCVMALTRRNLPRYRAFLC